MSRKQISLAFLVLVLLSAVAVIGGHYVFRGPSIDRAAFSKLKNGMTKPEVEAILGKPTTESDSMNSVGWRGTGESEGSICVLYDDNCTVKGSRFFPDYEPTPLEKIKTWLRLDKNDRSKDPVRGMHQLMSETEDRWIIENEWKHIWFTDKPSDSNRVHDGNTPGITYDRPR